MPPKKAAPAAKKAPAKPAAAKAAAPKKAAANKGAAAAAAAAPPAPPMGQSISLKAMARFVFDDKASELKKSGRWAVISDESENAMTFLRHRNVNMLNCMDPDHMQAERIRLAILGGLRYGKPVVFDMMSTDVCESYPRLVNHMEAVKPGLMQAILDRSILKEEYFKDLIQDGDGEEYKTFYFQDDMLENFAFVIASATTVFPPEVVQNFFVVTIE